MLFCPNASAAPLIRTDTPRHEGKRSPHIGTLPLVFHPLLASRTALRKYLSISRSPAASLSRATQNVTIPLPSLYEGISVVNIILAACLKGPTLSTTRRRAPDNWDIPHLVCLFTVTFLGEYSTMEKATPYSTFYSRHRCSLPAMDEVAGYRQQERKHEHGQITEWNT